MYKFEIIKPNRDELMLTVGELFELVEGTQYEEQLRKHYKPEVFILEKIPILGMRALFTRMRKHEAEVERIDVHAFTHKVEIRRLKGSSVFTIVDEHGEVHVAKPVHSAGRDYLNSEYQMFKHDELLNSVGLSQDAEATRRKVEKARVDQDRTRQRSFRLLRNLEPESLELRAVTSVDRYNDYGVPFSIVAAVMEAFRYAKATGEQLELARAHVRDYQVSLAITQQSPQLLKGVGTVRFGITLDNDEVKQRALTISAYVVIEPSDKGKAVHLRPPNNKVGESLKVGHGLSVPKTFNLLSRVGSFVNEAEIWILEDLKRLATIKPNKLRHWLENRLTRTKNAGLQPHQKEFRKLLDREISTVEELLHLMGRLDEVAEDFEAKDELSFLFYQMVKKPSQEASQL